MFNTYNLLYWQSEHQGNVSIQTLVNELGGQFELSLIRVFIRVVFR